MDTVEKGFLKEIEEGDPFSVIPYYLDWLEEKGREEEVKFWRWVLRERSIPYLCHYVSTYTYNAGLNWEHTFDWYDRSSMLWPERSGAQLPGKVFNSIKRRHEHPTTPYREYASRLEAYAALREALKNVPD